MPDENPKQREAAVKFAEWPMQADRHVLSLSKDERDFLLYALGFVYAGKDAHNSEWVSKHHFAILERLK
jgi:hypothetical protein